MNRTATVATPPRPAPGPFNPKRNKIRDLGTDRSEAYNRANNTQIANNHMLDRFLRNREELQKMGVKISE